MVLASNAVVLDDAVIYAVVSGLVGARGLDRSRAEVKQTASEAHKFP